MPLYEYECRQCHRRLEKIQKYSDPELTVCPHCGGALERTITAAAVSFKGGGWYKDLYSSAKPAAKAGEGAGGSAAGDSGGAASAAGESAPATAAPAAAAPAAASSGPSPSSGSASS